MERFSQRENVLLGYSLQRSFENLSPSPKTQPDIDFHDVFGGPPRRSSMQEMRYSLNSTKTTSRGEEDPVLPIRPWSSGPNEMPVFGEELVNRRRYPSDDFFDDIFRGDDSVGSPIRSNHDPFGSNPGSRVMSPARPLPPRADPFGTSLPAQFQFSLPAKLTKAIDLPVSASSSRGPNKFKDPASNGISSLYAPSPLLSRLSSEASQEEDELKNEIRPSYRPSPLSHEFSLSSKESPYEIKSGEVEPTDIGRNLKKDLKTMESPSHNSQFHFSIYKWASIGVPLLVPLRRGNSLKSKESVKIDRCSSSNGRIKSNNLDNGLETPKWIDSDPNFLNQRISADDESPYTEVRKQDKSSLTKDRVEPSHIVEEAVLSMPESKSINEIPNMVENVPGNEERVPICKQDAEKQELKPLRSLLSDTAEEQGNDEISRKSGEEDIGKNTTVSGSNAQTKKEKKRDEKRTKSNRTEVNQVNELHSQDSRKASGDNPVRNGAMGKVKDFVKVFNQETASKPTIGTATRSQSFRWKNQGSLLADNEESASTSQTNEKSHVHSMNKMKTPLNDSFTADRNLEEPEKRQSQYKSGVFNASQNSFGQKDTPASSSDSFLDGSKVSNVNLDDLFQENFMDLLKEFSNSDQEKPLQTADGYEDIKTSDAKIRHWSNGKAGNIRSLLSTLQYVLWPGSGWKPVPLMDIIEGSAVKRAYQKALLCLHPDKLQQKGAATYQKYIAEKVFDILQEAWDHFNTLGEI